MGKDDDAERRALGGRPIPARPKRPGGTAALDELLGQRKAQLFTEEQPEQTEQTERSELNYDAFHSFRLILKTLNKYPKATQREMISLLNELLAGKGAN
jgi:hypothetical protein